jgi:hypothetical protein
MAKREPTADAILCTTGTQNALTLTDAERAEFDAAKVIVREGIATYVAVGQALQRINDGKWYKADGFPTFEAFCHAEYDISRRRAYQMMEAAKTATDLSAEGKQIPATERAARTIAAKVKTQQCEAPPTNAASLALREYVWSEQESESGVSEVMGGSSILPSEEVAADFETPRTVAEMAAEQRQFVLITKGHAVAFTPTDEERTHLADCGNPDLGEFLHSLFSWDMKRVKDAKEKARRETGITSIPAINPTEPPAGVAPWPRTVTMYAVGDPRRRVAEQNHIMACRRAKSARQVSEVAQ